MPIAISVDLRAKFSVARDQGDRPTCMAFAASDAHAVARGPFQALSAEYAHYRGIKRKAIFDPNSGVPLHLMLEALELDGQPIEAGWPYLQALPADLKDWKPPASATPIFTRKGQIQSAAVDSIIRALDGDRPAVTVLRISLSFHMAQKGSVIRHVSTDPDTGIHAVVAVGYGAENGQRCILIRNSWGDWCDDGYAWLEETYLAPRILSVAVMS